jgi:hypothetical protein
VSFPLAPLTVVGVVVEATRNVSSSGEPFTASEAMPVALTVLSRLTPISLVPALIVTLVLLAKVLDSNVLVPRSEIVSCPGVGALSSPTLVAAAPALKVKLVTGTVSVTGSTLA